MLGALALAQAWVVVAELWGQLCDTAFDLSGLGILEAVSTWFAFLSFFLYVHVCACLCM